MKKIQVSIEHYTDKPIVFAINPVKPPPDTPNGSTMTFINGDSCH